MSARKLLGPKDEQGAALILAIAFLVLMSAIGAAVMSSVSSGVGDRAVLDHVRDRQYDADGAIETWIAQIRNTASGACGPSAKSFAKVNEVAIHVDCSPAPAVIVGGNGDLVSQNNLIFTACAKTGAGADGQPCTQIVGQVNTAIINAQVNFQGSSAPLTTFVQSWSVNS